MKLFELTVNSPNGCKFDIAYIEADSKTEAIELYENETGWEVWDIMEV